MIQSEPPTHCRPKGKFLNRNAPHTTKKLLPHLSHCEFYINSCKTRRSMLGLDCPIKWALSFDRESWERVKSEWRESRESSLKILSKMMKINIALWQLIKPVGAKKTWNKLYSRYILPLTYPVHVGITVVESFPHALSKNFGHLQSLSTETLYLPVHHGTWASHLSPWPQSCPHSTS